MRAAAETPVTIELDGALKRESSWAVEPASDGIVFLRSASAGVPQPADWRRRLADSLGSTFGTSIVAAKRLAADGRTFSMGEFVLHPKSFHHVGRGVDGEAHRFPEEVDAIVGGVMALREETFERASGAALLARELGPLDLCLSVRRDGGRVITVPDVTVIDERRPAPDDDESKRFRERWGFDWRVADLDEARRLHAGSGLLWHERFHGRPMPFEKYARRGALHWDAYGLVDTYRRRADRLCELLVQVTPKGGRVLDLGCGDGLFTHLLARAGFESMGVDCESGGIELARSRVERERYPGAAPDFLAADAADLPLESSSFTTVAMLDVIEHLPQPVAVLREAARVLRPGGCLLVSTPAWQFGGSSDPVYHVCEYSLEELVAQIEAATGLTVVRTGSIGREYRDIIAIASRPA